MRRIKSLLLAVVAVLVLFGCSQPEPAPKQAGGGKGGGDSKKFHKLNFDAGGNAFNMRVEPGDNVTWARNNNQKKVRFPLTSPCEGGKKDGVDACDIADIKAESIFPFTCDDDSCSDPEIDVGTDDGKVPPDAALNMARKAPPNGPTLVTLQKNLYLECVSNAAALYPKELSVLAPSADRIKSVINWRASGASAEKNWRVTFKNNSPCENSAINQGQSTCNVTAAADKYDYTIELMSPTTCGTKTVDGTIYVR